MFSKYDKLTLECDGFSQVVSYLLKKKGIAHKVFIGSCKYRGIDVPLHLWVDVGEYRIDYKLRMWTDETAPHGVFLIKGCPVSYRGEETNMDVPDFIFKILTARSFVDMATATAKKSKWNQEKVEKKLLTALKELGKGNNQIAESLKKKRIKGDPTAADECPVAIFVAKLFKDAESLSVGEEEIDVTLDGTTYSVDTPAIVGRFIANFDTKKYSFLVADSYTGLDEEEE